MFEVLVFVYENYWRGDACPELPQLGRKLGAMGFDDEEIQQALVWLDGLNLAARNTQLPLRPTRLTPTKPPRRRPWPPHPPTACACMRWPSRTTWAPSAWAL